jgi:hypothetical protein
MVRNSVAIYGPTDVEGFVNNEIGMPNMSDRVIYRSDYLAKLVEYIDTENEKMAHKVVGVGPDFEARGYDADHQYITEENGVKRAWRYVAVVSGRRNFKMEGANGVSDLTED